MARRAFTHPATFRVFSYDVLRPEASLGTVLPPHPPSRRYCHPRGPAGVGAGPGPVVTRSWGGTGGSPDTLTLKPPPALALHWPPRLQRKQGEGQAARLVSLLPKGASPHTLHLLVSAPSCPQETLGGLASVTEDSVPHPSVLETGDI